MKAKEYLSQIPIIRSKVRNKRERLARIEGILTSPAVGELKRDKVQTSIESHKQENLIAEKALIEADINALLQREAELLIRIGRQIDGMETAIYARILHLRYEEDISLPAIADMVHYSYCYVRHLHGSALLEFTRLYQDDMM